MDMPLSMVQVGENRVIQKVTGKDETRRFLENLGFVTGSDIMVVSEVAGNMIINVKDTRVAINKAMANRIIV
jgi:ferrous iron transport protein A